METTPQEERKKYKELGTKTQKIGETWYPIDSKWFGQWKKYTAYGLKVL